MQMRRWTLYRPAIWEKCTNCLIAEFLLVLRSSAAGNCKHYRQYCNIQRVQSRGSINQIGNFKISRDRFAKRHVSFSSSAYLSIYVLLNYMYFPTIESESFTVGQYKILALSNASLGHSSQWLGNHVGCCSACKVCAGSREKICGAKFDVDVISEVVNRSGAIYVMQLLTPSLSYIYWWRGECPYIPYGLKINIAYERGQGRWNSNQVNTLCVFPLLLSMRMRRWDWRPPDPILLGGMFFYFGG